MVRNINWPGKSGHDVECIACGEELSRSQAREYHKDGNRWDRQNKHIEYMCKDCHRNQNHQSRDGLEETLIDINAGTLDTVQFIERYYEAAGDELEADR